MLAKCVHPWEFWSHTNPNFREFCGFNTSPIVLKSFLTKIIIVEIFCHDVKVCPLNFTNFMLFWKILQKLTMWSHLFSLRKYRKFRFLKPPNKPWIVCKVCKLYGEKISGFTNFGDMNFRKLAIRLLVAQISPWLVIKTIFWASKTEVKKSLANCMISIVDMIKSNWILGCM